MALQSLALAQWKSNQVVLPVPGWIGQAGAASSSCLSGRSWELGVDALISCQRNLQAHALPSPAIVSAEVVKVRGTASKLLTMLNVRNQ